MEKVIREFLKETVAVSGSGSGYGSGDGYGYGDGSGSGSGDGYGSGYGSGYGHGYGYGSGSGYGYGYGYCDGLSAVNGQRIYRIDGVPTRIDKVKGEVARGAILNADFTFTPCYIAKYNGYFGHGAHLGDSLKAAIDKYEENMPESARIDAFVNAHKPDVSYPNSDFFKWHNKLTGSCEMGRKQFAKDHGIDLEDRMTVQEFIFLTESAYGGNIIKKLKPFYGMVE